MLKLQYLLTSSELALGPLSTMFRALASLSRRPKVKIESVTAVGGSSNTDH